MHCRKCGVFLTEDDSSCAYCGQEVYESENCLKASRRGVGYSSRISEPAFAQYINNNNRWSAIFSMILSIAAISGFFIYGETSSEMENPQALFIGIGIGGMFLLIALFQILGRKRNKTWDGVVVDKMIKKKNRQRSTVGSDHGYYVQYYTEYVVVVQSEHGKIHRMVAEDDDTIFNYYQLGDHVRHHGGLNSYEKYDKTHDQIIFCIACGTLCDISEDFCCRCKCPLLK